MPNAKSGEVNSSARRNHFKRQRSLIVNHKRSRILMTGHDDYGLLCKKSGGGSMLTCSTIENCTKAWRLIELMLTPLSRCIFEAPRSQLPAPWVLRCRGNVSLWPFEPLLSPAFFFDNWMSIQVDNDICMLMISFYRLSESLSCTILYLLLTYLRISDSIMDPFTGFRLVYRSIWMKKTNLGNSLSISRPSIIYLKIRGKVIRFSLIGNIEFIFLFF